MDLFPIFFFSIVEAKKRKSTLVLPNKGFINYIFCRNSVKQSKYKDHEDEGALGAMPAFMVDFDENIHIP